MIEYLYRYDQHDRRDVGNVQPIICVEPKEQHYKIVGGGYGWGIGGVWGYGGGFWSVGGDGEFVSVVYFRTLNYYRMLSIIYGAIHTGIYGIKKLHQIGCALLSSSLAGPLGHPTLATLIRFDALCSGADF